MIKLLISLLGIAFLCIPARADSRPNPRGNGATAKTAAAAQSLTNRNTKELETKEQVAENSRSNRSTANRGGVVSANRPGVRMAAVAASGAPAAVSRAATSMAARSAIFSAAAIAPDAGVSRGAAARSAAPVIKSGATQKSSSAARSAVRAATVGALASGSALPAGRGGGAGTARATALFTNMASMGEGYSQCRESYFACMDQFCGLKSDTYRRCLCSNQFRGFKDREDAFDQAKQMITQFNDNNLNAIDKSASEVNAMYSATQGEAAMKRDTSASAMMLENINALLSGKKKADSASSDVKKDMGGSKGSFSLDLDFSGGGAGDIWGDGADPFSSDSSSIFGGGRSNNSKAVDVETLEGNELYNAVNKQCREVSTACNENQSQANMVVSAYTILISQDCSAYEKKLDAQKTALESTIREANKMLMDARLEDFRNHNSADVNECIGKVRADMQNPYACGPNWQRCLDFTGRYINPTTGEPVYTTDLFNLSAMIDLSKIGIDGTLTAGDSNTKTFLDGLDSYKNRVEASLDTCRGKSDEVWGAFKSQALIEIKQAQDAKIEEIKNNCITTMKECYDKQSGDMNNFAKVEGDDEMSSAVQTSTAALGQRAAKALCEEKVLACSLLYTKAENVNFCSTITADAPCGDGGFSGAAGCQSRFQKLKTDSKCGVAALMAFVDTVDDTKISLFCKRDLEAYMKDLCTPGGNPTAPASNASSSANVLTAQAGTSGCVHQLTDFERSLAPGSDINMTCTQAELEAHVASLDKTERRKSFPWQCRSMPYSGSGSLYEAMIRRALVSCVNPENNKFDESVKTVLRDLLADAREQMQGLLAAECRDWSSGTWVTGLASPTSDTLDIDIVAEYAVGTDGIADDYKAFAKTIPSGITAKFIGNDAASATTVSGNQTVDGAAGDLILSLIKLNSGAAVPTDLIDSSDLKAQGYGYCMLATNKVRCEQMNGLIASGTLATYNAAAQTCSFTPQYYQTVCTTVLNGVWDSGSTQCKYVPGG